MGICKNCGKEGIDSKFCSVYCRKMYGYAHCVNCGKECKIDWMPMVYSRTKIPQITHYRIRPLCKNCREKYKRKRNHVALSKKTQLMIINLKTARDRGLRNILLGRRPTELQQFAIDILLKLRKTKKT